MSAKASLRIVELLERARIEGDWTHVSQVRHLIIDSSTLVGYTIIVVSS